MDEFRSGRLKSGRVGNPASVGPTRRTRGSRRAARAAALAACLAALAAVLAVLPAGASAPNEWTTYHRDNSRSGVDPDAASPVTPALAWQSPNLGAPIWSEPLIHHQLAYVATVGDEMYALNVSTGQVVWRASAGTAVPSSELPCGDISPTVGIVGTPVIDPSTGSIYAVADVWNASTKQAAHFLVGFNLQSGERTVTTPVNPPGSDGKAILQRTALTLLGGNIYFGFGGNDGDCSDYKGAVVKAPEDGGSGDLLAVPAGAPILRGRAVLGGERLRGRLEREPVRDDREPRPRRG